MSIKLIIFLIFFSSAFCQSTITIKSGDRTITKEGMKNIDDVINYYDSLKVEYPDSFQILADLATVYQIDNQYENAIFTYKSILNKFPKKLTKIANKYSSCYEELGKIDTAIVIMKNALNHCEECPGLHIGLANIYIGSKEYIKAFQEFQKVDTFKVRNSSMFWNNFAFVCSELDTTIENALQYAIRAIELNPEFHYFETLGDLLIKSKMYVEALEAYEIFLEEFELERVRDKVNRVKEIINKKN